MGSKIKLTDTSGRRISKKPKINQTDLTSNGTSIFIDENPVSGGSSIVPSDTYANWSSKKEAGTLPISSSVFLTDAYEGGGALLTTNQYGNGFEFDAVAYFLVPDFQRKGAYKNITGFSGQKGVWSPELEQGTVNYSNLSGKFGNLEIVFDSGVYAQIVYDSGTNYFYVTNITGDINPGDIFHSQSDATLTGITTSYIPPQLSLNNVVIWNNIHYLVTSKTGFTQSSPDSNPTVYQTLPSSTDNGYILEEDAIEYDFDQQMILWRKDKRGNVISSNSLSTFQFGDDSISDVKSFTTNTTINTLNNRGTISGVIVGTGSYIYVPNNSGNIYFDVNGTYQTLYTPNNTGTVEAHIYGFNSGLQAEQNVGQIKVYVYDSSYVYASNNSGDIYCRYLDGAFVTHGNNQGDINYCEFKNGFEGTITLNGGTSHYRNSFSNNLNSFSFFSSASYANKILTNTESTFDCAVDITGLNYIDLEGQNYVGQINISSSNTGETLTRIVNTPNAGFPIQLNPNAGLLLTIQKGNPDSINPNEIALQGVDSTLNLFGRSQASMSDFIVLLSPLGTNVNREVYRSILS